MSSIGTSPVSLEGNGNGDIFRLTGMECSPCPLGVFSQVWSGPCPPSKKAALAGTLRIVQVEEQLRIQVYAPVGGGVGGGTCCSFGLKIAAPMRPPMRPNSG